MQAALDAKLAGVLRVDIVFRVPVEPKAAACPAQDGDVIIAHVALQGFRDPDHQKEIAVRQAREAGIEGAENEGFLVDLPSQRRA